MSQSFLQLPEAERSKILRALGPRLERAPLVLEKDVWVCWVLQQLFTLPGRLPMAFKGGTSLSKVYGAIARLSEDVDVTLDYRGLDGSFDPFAPGISKSRLRTFSDGLKAFVADHAKKVVAPHFEERLQVEFGAQAGSVEVSDNGEQIRVRYPTALRTFGEYLGNSVLVELGGRNITEPQEHHEVTADLAEHLPDLELPTARVTVLSPKRTFWEKATLIHVECHRGQLRLGADRLSRHWYDLAMLADQDIGRAALADLALLADVVKHKKMFFGASFAHYDACLEGKLRLLPELEHLSSLENDYERMVRAGMFFGQAPSFGSIVERLRTLEASINEGAPVDAGRSVGP